MVNTTLQRFKRDELSDIVQFIIANLTSNIDVFYELEVLKRPPLPTEIKNLYQDAKYTPLLKKKDHECINKVLRSKDTLKKRELLAIVDHVMTTRYLLEAFCIAYVGDDESLGSFCAMVGYGENYKRLLKDFVYLKRRKHVHRMAAYAKAAVNLYGVVRVDEVFNIIKHFEGTDKSDNGYKREKGTYRFTVMADPKNFNVIMLYAYLEGLASNIPLTIDGLLLAGVFGREYVLEVMELSEKLAVDHHLTNKEFDDILNELSKRFSYRKFYEKVFYKPFYVPKEREDFLKYEDITYSESGEGLNELFTYMKTKFTKRLKLPNEFKILGIDFAIEDCLKELCSLVNKAASDHNEQISTSLEETLNTTIDLLRDFGIRAKKDEKIAMTLILTKVMDEKRNWQNRGFTDLEMRTLEEKEREERYEKNIFDLDLAAIFGYEKNN